MQAGAGISPLGSLAMLCAAGIDLASLWLGFRTGPVWGAGEAGSAAGAGSCSCLACCKGTHAAPQRWKQRCPLLLCLAGGAFLVAWPACR